jgi:hypothetical protein
MPTMYGGEARLEVDIDDLGVVFYGFNLTGRERYVGYISPYTVLGYNFASYMKFSFYRFISFHLTLTFLIVFF